MKKILTIAATALLSTIAGAAHAQTTATVNFPGTVTSSCTLSASANGTLLENGTPAFGLTTGTPGTVTAICNGATSLDIAIGRFDYPTPQTVPVPAVGFAGGTGVFATAAGMTTSLAAPTGSSGDVARINAVVNTASGQLLRFGSYTIIVNASITP